MAKLEEITVGTRVRGLAGDNPVTVVAVNWHGGSSISVAFKTEQGALDESMVFRSEEDGLTIEGAKEWGFDADADDLKLVSEAYRISLAHLFDPYLAIRTSAIEPLPHQISAVYKEMLPRLPLRYVLADDPGAGKTIMTGLLIKEMIVRGDLKRCLIVAPGNLVEQWQDELYRKFGLNFSILTNEMFEASVTGNAFNENNFCIARLDKLSRDEAIKEKLSMSSWDLVVCDEAHKMSATNFGGKPQYTKRYRLGELLGETTENLLLLTATPHNGKPADFQYFMALVDKDRFAGANRVKNSVGTKAFAPQPGTIYQTTPDTVDFVGPDVSDVMRRLVKEELLKFDGRPLFPERIAYTVNYSLSDAESELYELVTKYVTEEFNRADRLDGKRKNSVGFALTILQRRLASSPEAIYQSLKRRRERLESKLQEVRFSARHDGLFVDLPFDVDDEFDEDDYSGEELEDAEEDIMDSASAAATIAELEAEISSLKMLERKANGVRSSGVDRKWDELSKLLQDNESMFGDDGRREKLIIFTEHKDTLNYLASKIRSLIGNADAVLTIRGGMRRDDRRKAEERFKQDKDVRILIATDAAGEGINLQRAHLMINYDLSWNPNRLEQRFGRIHRIGQSEVCHLWNLVSNQTREGDVFNRLFSKLEQERAALGGKVFDILGRLTFDDRPLRDLLVEAIRYGDDPEVKARLNQVVDNSLNPEAIKELLREYALTADVMDVHNVMSIREDMERMEARKLEPHFIESFFLAAMKKLGGRVEPREQNRYQVLEVPASVRLRDMKVGAADPILKSYERICFDKSACENQTNIPAELVYPGHPLLDATVDVLIEQLSGTLKKGSIFIDDQDFGAVPRLLFYIEDSIQDGTVLPDGKKKVISKSIRFVEINEKGEAASAGYAPYLDYRAPKKCEIDQVKALLPGIAIANADVERLAMDFAIEKIVPQHLQEVKAMRLAQIKKIEKAVIERLSAEIRYWDSRSWELKDKEQAGKKNARLNSDNAARRANDLAERLDRRKEQLALEKKIGAVPPRVVGGALVIPVGMIRSQTVDATTFAAGGKRVIELAGMRAVMNIERKLGNAPTDVSATKCGYDIESKVPEELCGEGPILRMIEVKARAKGAETVTISKNEVLCGLNNPEGFILAIVEVDGDHTKTVYLKKPFDRQLGFAEASSNFNISKLMQVGTLLLEKEETWQ